jgi:hypothetical protein
MTLTGCPNLTNESPVPPLSDELLEAYMVDVGADRNPLTESISTWFECILVSDLAVKVDPEVEAEVMGALEVTGVGAEAAGLAKGNAGENACTGAI